MSWHRVELGDVSRSVQTGPFGSQLHQSDYSEDGIPVVMPKDLVDGHISEASIARVSSEHVERLSRHKIEKGDILYSRRGDVGRCAYASEKEVGWLCGTGCLRVSVNPVVANSKYVFYQLQKPETVGWVINHAVGATMLNLNTSILSAIPLNLPSIENQNRTVDILSSYDELIENNQHQIKLLEEAAQRLYKEWFVDLHFPGHEQVKIVDGVPEGWKKKSLGKVINVIRGRSYSSKELSEKKGTLMVNLSSIRPFGGYNRGEEKFYNGKYNQEQIVETHDLIMGVTDMTQERRTVGRVAVVPNLHKDAMISMDLIKLVPIEGSPLFYYALLKYGGYSEIVSRFANGTNVMHLRSDVLNVVDVIMPTMELQNRYTVLFEAIQSRIDALQDQVLAATEARDRLLPKLMSGEIEV